MTRIARDVRDTDLPQVAASVDPTPIRVAVGAEAGEYEQHPGRGDAVVRRAGLPGHPGMDDIAAAAGLPTTSLYRFFTGKGRNPGRGVSAGRRPGVR